MLIIGHRGASGLAPENTVSSFKKAQELGVNMVEMDLRMDRHGRIVVAHDEDFGREYEQAPNLQEALAEVEVAVNLEIKESGFEAKLLEMIKGFPFEVLISSFEPSILRKIRILDRKAKLGLIVGPKLKWFYFLVPMVLFFKLSLGLAAVNPYYSLLTKHKVWLLKKLGVKVLTWVVNDPDEFKQVKGLGVDGVFTDRPDLIKR
ncbi:MAG: glycerophosphodiester phosphodiesterase [Candidatus Doudnabacteria bacterium]|nr:glycerophosphodiester phosphodiesterase [Candidatus Doudnabacteria bacterium]